MRLGYLKRRVQARLAAKRRSDAAKRGWEKRRFNQWVNSVWKQYCAAMKASKNA